MHGAATWAYAYLNITILRRLITRAGAVRQWLRGSYERGRTRDARAPVACNA